MPAEFHWLRPEWLLAVPCIAAAAWLLARRRLLPGSWQRVIDPALLPHVLSGAPQRGREHRWWLLFLGGTLAAVALAGPSWQRIEQPVFRSEQALVIALDLSRSMDAEDVTPSRLARARLKVLDILGARQSGQTALLVYSGTAFTVTPLTTDTDTIAALVNSIDTSIMPSRGSNPVAAIDKGRSLLEQAGVNDGEILLITDGGASAAAEKAAAELRGDGYSLSVLGVGTLSGAPIPVPGGGFMTDSAGKIAVPKLGASGLRSLAAAGGGRFAVIATDDRDIDALLSDRVSGATRAGEDLATDLWQEEGPWLLLLLLPLAALAFRRGWVFAVLIFVFPMAPPAHAFGWEDLWETNDQQARGELADGNAAEAAALFQNRDWQGVAAYRAGDYEQSAAAFAGRGDVDGLYNLGNALARQGELEPAIEAYERALEIDPHAEDAAYNRDLVKSLLKKRQQGDKNGGKGQKQSSSEGGKDQNKAGAQGDGKQADEQGNAGGATSDPQSGDADVRSDTGDQEDMKAVQRELERAAREAAEQSQDAAKGQRMSPEQLAAQRRAQEQQQALEQWLRRVPDDPGGLLRRKFRYQYQRQGVDQDGRPWPDYTGDPW